MTQARILIPADLAAVLRTVPDLDAAACRGMPPLFDDTLPDETEDERAARHRLVRRVCAGCAARPACAIAASRDRQASGVWAGRLRHARRHDSDAA